ncbi:MAG TPA: hypothetical protein VHU85_03750 [Acidimicrobiales bacterium]|nr:hypothetical protein [Acidimicrobiales bacterium]
MEAPPAGAAVAERSLAGAGAAGEAGAAAEESLSAQVAVRSGEEWYRSSGNPISWWQMVRSVSDEGEQRAWSVAILPCLDGRMPDFCFH